MSNKASADVLLLPPQLDFAGALALASLLRDAIRAGDPVRLDVSAVASIALPCVQVLLAAAKSHPHFLVSESSAPFAAAFEDIGIGVPFDVMADADKAPVASPDNLPTHDAGNLAPDLEPSGYQQEDAISQPTAGKTILTIDDSRTIRDLLMVTLTDAGYQVTQGVDGEDGLNVLGDSKVDLIITDINMPKMDGYEVIRRVRANAAHDGTPILVLTTEGDKEKRAIAREAGATGWLVKPFDPDRLIETVRKVVS